MEESTLMQHWNFLCHVGPQSAIMTHVVGKLWNCERLFPMEDRAARLEGNYQKLLTILSKEIMSTGW